MGMRRAKEFSEGLRKVCRLISTNNRLVLFTNQIRENLEAGAFGSKETTPGGKALPFYASLRLRVGPTATPKIYKEITIKGQKVKKVIGINSEVYVAKSTIDEPYRHANISIIFGYGVDDIRDNIQYIKKMTGETRYRVVEHYFQSINEAIEFCEQNQLQEQVREEVIGVWESIEEQMKIPRLPKVRR